MILGTVLYAWEGNENVRVPLAASTGFNKEVDRVTHQRDRERGREKEKRWRTRAMQMAHQSKPPLMSH